MKDRIQSEAYAKACRASGITLDEFARVMALVAKLSPTAKRLAEAMRNTAMQFQKIKKEHKLKYVNKHHKRYSNKSRW